MDLKGIGVAMVTPFKENGEIDFGQSQESLKTLLQVEQIILLY